MILLLCQLLSAALGAERDPVQLELRAGGAYVPEDPVTWVFVGGGGSFSWHGGGPFRLEASADLGRGQDGLRFDLRPELRVDLTRSLSGPVDLALSGGYLARWEGELGGAGALGLAVDLPQLGAWRPNLTMRALFRTTEFDALYASVGFRWSRPPEPQPVPEPVVEAPLRWYWLPHPVCRFVDEQELASLQAQDPQLRAEPVSEALNRSLQENPPGKLLSDSPKGPAALARATAPSPDPLPSFSSAPPRGALLVYAGAHEPFTVAGVGVSAGADGVALLSSGPEVVDIEVKGGGREQELSVRVPGGHVLWVNTPLPEAQRIFFDKSSAALSGPAQATLKTLAQRAGAWSFEVQCASSPEGNSQRNAALAQSRGEAVLRHLQAEGARSVRLNPDPIPFSPDSSYEEQRSCVVTPLPPEAP